MGKLLGFTTWFRKSSAKVARPVDTYKHQLRRCGKHLKVPWYSSLPELL